MKRNSLHGACGTYIVQNNKRLSPASIMIADSEEDALADDGRQDLLNEESQENGRDCREDKVVDNGQLLELESLFCAHDFAASQNEDIVEYDENARLLQGGHGCNASLEAKLAGWVAGEELKDLVEDGP